MSAATSKIETLASGVEIEGFEGKTILGISRDQRNVRIVFTDGSGIGLRYINGEIEAAIMGADA